MQGVELVNRLLLNEPETTIGIKYESTLDGRQAASHERSVKAGSGDPKKAADALKAGPSKGSYAYTAGDRSEELDLSKVEAAADKALKANVQTNGKHSGEIKLN
jgi:hypothetical protein